jgi:predicted permease
VTAIGTLAIAVAVNAAVFSVVDAALLKPLPYPRPDRLAAAIRSTAAAGAEPSSSVNGRTWLAMRDHLTAADAAVFSSWTTGVNMSPASASSSVRFVQQQRAGAGFFEVLGVQPALGRPFTAGEDRPGGPAVTILSAALWRQAFNADPQVVGRTIRLRGEHYEVVGVMPDGFHSGVDADLWTPLRAGIDGEGDGENYTVLLRLRDGADWTSLATEVRRIGLDLTPGAVPEKTLLLGIEPLQAALARDLRRPLLTLWGAVIAVLIAASVNLAGFFLTRASGRAREIATRLALGGGRGVIAWQLLTESLVLAIIGGALGLALGQLVLDGLKTLTADTFVIWQPISLDGRAVAAATMLSIVAALVFGGLPAWQMARLDMQRALTTGGRTVAGSSAHWKRRGLVVLQVATGVVLLVGATLLMRSYVQLGRLDAGFPAGGLLTASLSLQDERYRTGARVEHLFTASLAALTRSGVERAAVSLGLPYERLLNLGFRRLDGRGAGERGMTSATYVAGDFFGTLRLPVLQGRTFADADTSTAPGVAIVNRAFADEYFKGEDAVGRRIAFAGRDRHIIGVVGNVQVRPGWGDRGPLAAMPLAYVPLSQVNDATLRLVHGWFSPAFVVRAGGEARAAADALQRALKGVDPELPFARIRTIAEIEAETLSGQRVMSTILGLLALAAAMLACAGVYGLIAASVAERTREIGIRLALGATRWQAIGSVARPGVGLSVAGVVLGSVSAYALSGVMRHLVWGISLTDPATFAVVAATALALAGAASLLPALRVRHLDPAETLRRD